MFQNVQLGHFVLLQVLDVGQRASDLEKLLECFYLFIRVWGPHTVVLREYS